MAKEQTICPGCGETVEVDRDLGVTVSVEPVYATEPGRATIIEGSVGIHQCESGTYGAP